MENLGEKIKELRETKELTQPQLAKILNVSNGQISKWENGINEPKASYIKLLCNVFEITADFLLGLENEYNIKNDTEKKTKKIIQHLNINVVNNI